MHLVLGAPQRGVGLWEPLLHEAVMADSISSAGHPPLGHLGSGLGAFSVHEAGVIATGTSRKSLWLSVAMFDL